MDGSVIAAASSMCGVEEKTLYTVLHTERPLGYDAIQQVIDGL